MGAEVFPTGSGDDESLMETLCADGPGVYWGQVNRTGSLSQWRQRPGSGPEEWTCWCPPEADTRCYLVSRPVVCSSALLALEVVLKPVLDVHLVSKTQIREGEDAGAVVDRCLLLSSCL